MVFADVLCLRRRRRGDWRVKQPDAPVKIERRTQPVNRGCAKMPLPVTEDTPPDMLAGAMDIKVLLPSGRTVCMSVERSTQMMDLLVQLCTIHKLSLAAHTTVALSDSGFPLHHLPSTPLGALDTRLIHVAQRTNTLKRAPLRPNNAQPFTTTFRLQVHLPRNQLFVTRVSPDMRLADVLSLACSEKNLDPDKYELRHPANLCERLSLSHTLADYRLQEVTLVASRPPGAPLTPADIMALQREEEKRRQQVKKTGGIYSIIFNKRSKGTPEGSGSVSSDSLGGRSISPARSDESMERSVSPPEPVPPPRPGRKRRPAPKPPALAPAAPTSSDADVVVGVDISKESSTTLSHSRTSSDSSGYHEASVLSESPDTRTNSSADTLPRRSKLPSSNHIVTKNKSSTLQHGSGNGGNHNLSRSLSNLTAVGVTVQKMHSASTSSLASQGLGPRKKKAAPPPPAVLQGTNLVGPVMLPPTKVRTTVEHLTTPSQDGPLVPKPKLHAILDEEDIVVDSFVTKTPSSVPQAAMEQTAILEECTADIIPSRVECQDVPVACPDLVTSAIVHSPPDEEDELQSGILPILEIPPRSEDLEDVSEWQYHLPAPPSAFRDLHSPTTTEFETVVLADVDVFQEISGASKQPKQPNVPVHGVGSHQSSHHGVEEDATSFDSIANEGSVQSNETCSSLPDSFENHNQVAKLNKEVVSNHFAIKADEGWEPQTIVMAEKETNFNNSDLWLHQDGVIKEVYKVNPIFDAMHLEEDGDKRPVGSAEYPPNENGSIRNANIIHRGSHPDLQSSNQLKNFTISTYHKTKNVDSIFREDPIDSTEPVFKKPFIPSKQLVVTRTNSFTTSEQDRPTPTVKRSTSHVSLARPYSKPSTFQSINRTKSISNLVLVEEAASSSLRKTTSEVNLSQAEDVPLQSLQILKSILPRLSQSQVLYESDQAAGQSQEPYRQPPHSGTGQSQEFNRQPGITHSTNDRETLQSESVIKTVEPSHHPTQDMNKVKEPELKPAPFVYRGPPAISFATWSERPKIQVSLKSDRDYRMGKQPVNALHATMQQTSEDTPMTFTPKAKDAEYYVNSRTIAPNSFEETSICSIPKAKDYSSITTTTPTGSKKEKSTKIEPIPLTMRIVSHTQQSSHRSTTSLVENTAVSKTDPREERLPIVRAVELKKVVPESFVQLRSMSSTHLNGPNTKNVAHVPVSYHQGSFYNRYSYVEPGLSKPLGSVTNRAQVSQGLTRTMSTSQVDGEAAEVSVGPARKYTSVVGVNGGGIGSATVVQGLSGHISRFSGSSIKVNGFGGAKPMPTVKGFRFAGTEAANYDRVPDKINVQLEVNSSSSKNGVPSDSSCTTKQPLKTINGIENSKQKSSLSHLAIAAKVQQNSSVINNVEARLESRVPAPPKLPTTMSRKHISRHMSATTNPRDQLLEAIKNFGGRESLKPTSAQSNVILIK